MKFILKLKKGVNRMKSEMIGQKQKQILIRVLKQFLF